MTERLDAYVLQFPKGSPPTFVRYPVHRAESEAVSGPRVDAGDLSASPWGTAGAGAVSSVVVPEPRAVPSADTPHAGRVFRVISCPDCSWEYGAWWPRAEVYGYWGDCPKCGHITRVASAYRVKSEGASGAASGARSVKPAQQELGL